jgi:hypothetical protein
VGESSGDSEMSIRALPYVDIQVGYILVEIAMSTDECTFQHDALSVFDDVEQGTVHHEDIWVSGVCVYVHFYINIISHRYGAIKTGRKIKLIYLTAVSIRLNLHTR